MNKGHAQAIGQQRATYGAGLGLCAGLALGVIEISALAWRSQMPAEIATAIMGLDILFLTAIGFLAGWIARSRGVDPSPYILAALVAMCAFPAVMGKLMGQAWDRASDLPLAWLVGLTTTVGVLASLVLGMGLAALLAFLLRLWTRGAARWEVWAVVQLVVVAVFVATLFANYGLFPRFTTLAGLASNAAMGALLIALTYAAVVLTRSLPAGVTFAGALLVCVGAGLLLPASGGLGLRAAASQDERPNVILVVLDTVRADHLSLYGYSRSTSPNLDAFAEQAVVFEQAVSNSSWTLPAHASLFTGVDPRRHGAHGRKAGDDSPGPPFAPIAGELPTMAEVFRSEGYRTGAFVSNYGSLAPAFGFDRGFDTYDATPRSVVVIRPALGSIVSLLMPARYSAFIRPYREASDINESALAWTERTSNRPFFLFLNYMEAHHPYQPPPPFYDQYEGVGNIHDDQRVPWTWYERLRLGAHRDQLTVSTPEREHLTAVYDASISYLDHQLARLFDGLKQRSLLDSSLIMVTSDHGELFGEHDLVGHGFVPYEGVVRVPLVVRFPGGAQRRLIQQRISTREVFRLAMGLAFSSDAPERLLHSALQAPVVSEVYVQPREAGSRESFAAVHRAIYGQAHKLLRSSNGERRLFDLDADPSESADLSETLAAEAEALTERLDEWLASVPEPDPGAIDGQEVDEETLKRLKALGYLP